MKDKEFDLDDLFESDQPAPQTKPAPVVPEQPVVTWTTGQFPVNPLPVQPITVNWPEAPKSESPKPKRPWFTFVASVIGFALLGFAIGYSVAHVTNGDTVEPDTDPVTGAYVAIFYDDIHLTDYTKSQSDFIKSAITTGWLDEHKANWKLIDTDPLDVSHLEKPFQVMAEKHRSKEPWIVIAVGKKFASEPIESGEQAMKLLEKWVK